MYAPLWTGNHSVHSEFPPPPPQKGENAKIHRCSQAGVIAQKKKRKKKVCLEMHYFLTTYPSVWLAEAVSTNHFLVFFLPAIMPECFKFMIFGLSGIRNLQMALA